MNVSKRRRRPSRKEYARENRTNQNMGRFLVAMTTVIKSISGFVVPHIKGMR
jgi:hypothetical protein